jgi:hypothetical protein
VANPLVGDPAIAEPLMAALLDANRAQLPRFFDRAEPIVSAG